MSRINTKEPIEVFTGHKPKVKRNTQKMRNPKQINIRVPGAMKTRFDKYIKRNDLIKNAILMEMLEGFLNRVGA